MKKYFQVIRNTWLEMTTYRLNFVMWRIRVVLQILTMYFLWLALIPANMTLFGYSQSLMLTYILGTSLITSIVFSSRTQEIGENINSGDLSIFLIRPINYFYYWFSRDIGDKLMNTLFSITELFLLFIILHPPFFIQTKLLYLLLAFTSILLGVLLYFLFGSLLGLIGFWSPEVWGPRFIFAIIMSFFAGGLFPLDILPKSIFNLFQFLPFPYLLYFPLRIYLGKSSNLEILTGFAISLFWIFILYKTLLFVWKKGLKVYSAEGR
ncbi:MAG: ABC-2 family transporter protein [bacterium]|nr:ABC-2 family transporter protein [bacterium]